MTAVEERAAVATVPARVRRRALETPEVVALREKRFGIWQEVSWRRYWEQVELAAHGLAALGVSSRATGWPSTPRTGPSGCTRTWPPWPCGP